MRRLCAKRQVVLKAPNSRWLLMWKTQESEAVKKLAAENHREKLEKFNKALDSLPTHFDIPKVKD
jgi:hypothetical protein